MSDESRAAVYVQEHALLVHRILELRNRLEDATVDDEDRADMELRMIELKEDLEVVYNNICAVTSE